MNPLCPPPLPHDTEAALVRAEAHCTTRGTRLTPLRRAILALILARQGVVTAYDLLADLQAQRGKADPPTVYRALAFLVAQGLIHRVETLNAYVVCCQLGHTHASVLLLCERCQSIAELSAEAELNGLFAAAQGCAFQPRRQEVLLTGLCQACAA